MFTKDYLIEEYLIKRKSAREIAKENNCGRGKVEYWLSKYGIKKGRFKDVLNEDKIDLTNPIFNYYCGLVATDGYTDRKNTRIVIRLRNKGAKELLTHLKKYFEFTGSVGLYKERDYDLTMSSEKLLEVIDSLGIGEKKQYVKFPQEFHNEDCERMFLRGVLDGDGNIHTIVSKYTGNVVGGEFRIVHCSLDFVEGVIDCINNRLNLNCKLSYHHVKDILYPKLEMTVPDSLVFYNWIYRGYDEFKLSDKFERYKQITR